MKNTWEPGDINYQLGNRMPEQLTLDELLTVIDSLWPPVEGNNPRIKKFDCHYMLNRYAFGWSFEVVRSWLNWHNAKLKHEFGPYDKPEHALAEFLHYCLENNIQPHQLIDE